MKKEITTMKKNTIIILDATRAQVTNHQGFCEAGPYLRHSRIQRVESLPCGEPWY